MVEEGASSLTKQVDTMKAMKKVDDLHITACKAKISELEGELQAKDADLIGKDIALATKDTALAAKDIELVAKDAETAQLLKERTANFLGSRSFGCAASMATVKLLRYSIYDQLKNLGRSFSFRLKDLGYAPVLAEEAVVMSLAGYSWDTEKDLLQDAEGKPVVFERLALATGENTGLPYVWTDTVPWPADIPAPSEEEGEEEEEGESQGEGKDAQGPSNPAGTNDVVPLLMSILDRFVSFLRYCICV